MRTRIFQLDAFTSRLFAGNPAAVMVMEAFPPDTVMQALAGENNLPETAFLVPAGDDFQLRWFTPTVEVPLCGHATLASAAVVMERLAPGRTSVLFHSKSGPLPARRVVGGYVLDFPSRHSTVTDAPFGLVEALGAIPLEVRVDAFNYLSIFEHAQQVRDLKPDLLAISRLDRSGVIATAPGDGEYDCVSRYFAPAKGIPEDPVTGGAHCALAPYWLDRLRKKELRAYQASSRSGEIVCRMSPGADRVELEGNCVFYFEGEAMIP